MGSNDNFLKVIPGSAEYFHYEIVMAEGLVLSEKNVTGYHYYHAYS